MKRLVVSVEHNEYEKITDTCMWLNNTHLLKFNVELNSHPKNAEKINFHKEIGYEVSNEFRVNIYRDFNYYLSIESAKRSAINGGYKQQIKIGVDDIYFFRYKLHEACKWFTEQSIFAKKDGRIFIPVKVDSLIVKVQFGQTIEIEPAIMTLDNQDQIIGVNMYFNSSSDGIFININKLLALTYFIDTFNMYQSAQIMINYLGIPKLACNFIDLTNKKKFLDPSNNQN